MTTAVRCGVCGKFLSQKPYPHARMLPGSVLKVHMEEAHGWKKDERRRTSYGIESRD